MAKKNQNLKNFTKGEKIHEILMRSTDPLQFDDIFFGKKKIKILISQKSKKFTKGEKKSVKVCLHSRYVVQMSLQFDELFGENNQNSDFG